MTRHLIAIVVVVGTVGCLNAAECKTQTAGGQFCIPDGGSVSANGSIELLDTCSYSCGVQGQPVCNVAVDGGVITLFSSATVCERPSGMECPAICAFTRMKCALGGVPPGTYTVSSAGQPTRQLVIASDGGAETCVIAIP